LDQNVNRIYRFRFLPVQDTIPYSNEENPDRKVCSKTPESLLKRVELFDNKPTVIQVYDLTTLEYLDLYSVPPGYKVIDIREGLYDENFGSTGSPGSY
jgi:hypothetical protein